MIKKYIVFLGFISIVFGQISVSDINKITNNQLDSIREELKDNKDLDSEILDDTSISEDSSFQEVQIEPNASDISEEYFGYDYFRKQINFYDNIPTPQDFKLGPGDEVIISLWGETNLRKKFTINKEGLVYYENIGFINLANKNIEDAESVLKDELSRIYSTLRDGSTELMLEIEELKAINVYFSGQIEKPGINLVHPFSDIFSAIVQAGGVKIDGSLRKIELIRSNQTISTIDFYSFFTDGKDNFSKIRILDGDTIHIPEFSIRSEIKGEVLNEGFFELLKGESISDLIDYAGGLSKNASSSAIADIIIPVSERSSDDNALVSKNINLNESKNFKITNGFFLKILPIADVETKVEIFGRVKLPGQYSGSATLKEVLDIAGGFNDPLYRQTIRDDEIVVLRKDINQFYGLEFKIPYAESDKFNLIAGDKIFVYENSLYENLFSVEVIGEVNKRGTFQLKKGMKVIDAISLAEGFTELANKDAIVVNEIFTSIDDLGNEIEERRQVNDATLNFELTDNSIINVLPLENVVSVEGNVYNPGLITFSKGKTVNKYINLAGGPKPNTLSTRIYVQRANGRIKKVTLFQGVGTIVRPGDTIFVPLDSDPQEFDVTSFISDLATTLANIAAILLVIDNQND